MLRRRIVDEAASTIFFVFECAGGAVVHCPKSRCVEQYGDVALLGASPEAPSIHPVPARFICLSLHRLIHLVWSGGPDGQFVRALKFGRCNVEVLVQFDDAEDASPRSFSIPRDEPLSVVLGVLRRSRSCEHANMELAFHGSIVDDRHTPNTLGLVNGDVLIGVVPPTSRNRPPL